MRYPLDSFAERKSDMNWYVTAFSKLTNVSVRTLHHYDAIGLLKPSLRSEGNYRLYSESDLYKLQTIVALKFFGFKLVQIKVLVKQKSDFVQQLMAQQRCLHEQLLQQQSAIRIIDELVRGAAAGKPLAWSKIVESIEGYNMRKDMSATWMEQSLSPDQIKLWTENGQRFSKEEIVVIEARWASLIARAKALYGQDPSSSEVQKISKEWKLLVDEMYGESYELRDAMWLAYKHNKIPNAPFDKQLWDFIDKAQQASKK